MRQLGMLVRLEYTGSTCEQANVANSPDNYYLEHDVMIIMNGRETDLQLETMPMKAGLARLKFHDQGAAAAASPRSTDLFGHVEGDYLNAPKTADRFFDQLQKCINSSKELSRYVTLTVNGPSAQMTANHEEAFFYPVDMIPTYE